MKFVTAINKLKTNQALIVLVKSQAKSSPFLNADELKMLHEAQKDKRQQLYLNNGKQIKIVVIVSDSMSWELSEKLRKQGAKCCQILNEHKIEEVTIASFDDSLSLALAEGLVLANYQFIKYFSAPDKQAYALQHVNILGNDISDKQIQYLNTVIDATYMARNLVNEPQSHLNAVQLSEAFKKIGKQAGFNVEVWNESKINAQKMGGLMAVNKGSKTPPTFNIMEYKPKQAKNKKPIVLVGKGVVYDTGGLSLKPTPMSMDHMKCDMAGAAIVVAVMHAVASLKMNLHVIGLVPATDNWIGENSYAPGDVITMYDGTTVEVLNTDAEGRLILADALHYAKKLNPELVCDFATLTGAAVRAIGPYATAFMCKANDNLKNKVFESSYSVFERLVEFPLWQEYADELKSNIADMTNLGKGEGGQISAAKFLEHFTDYPWMHFDIAGPAFNHAVDAYKPKGGTGVGVRLMIDFLTQLSQK